MLDDAFEGGKPCLALFLATGLLGLVLLLLPFVLGSAFLFFPLLFGLVLRHALFMLGFPLSGFLFRLLFGSGRQGRRWVGSLIVLLMVGVHRAIVVEADRHRVSHILAEHDDGGLGAGARGLGVRIVGVGQFAVLVPDQRTGSLFLGRTPCGFNGDEFRPRSHLAVDVSRHLALEARRIEALIALHVRKQARVESAAAWAADASSHFRFEGSVLAVEGRFRKIQVEVGLNPCAQVLCRKQVRFLVLPVLAPAILEGFSLMFLRQTGR